MEGVNAQRAALGAPRQEAIARAEAWFASRGWTVFPFQREVWDAYLAGQSGLVHAATGTGKTLAAWLGPVIAER